VVLPEPFIFSCIAARGAKVAESPGDAVAEADIVCMILENRPVVERVLFERRTAQRIRPGSLVIDLSSIPPETAKEHALRLARQGVDHLDAPVSGGPYGAEAGSLAIMVGAAAIAAVSEALLLAKPAGFFLPGGHVRTHREDLDSAI
jgi:2-hydroxy-3-oxopropionate reductase